jgi:hypothetical protein
MCASPLSPRHAQPDWIGGGLVSDDVRPDPVGGPRTEAQATFGPRQGQGASPVRLGLKQPPGACFDRPRRRSPGPEARGR